MLQRAAPNPRLGIRKPKSRPLYPVLARWYQIRRVVTKRPSPSTADKWIDEAAEDPHSDRWSSRAQWEGYLGDQGSSDLTGAHGLSRRGPAARGPARVIADNWMDETEQYAVYDHGSSLPLSVTDLEQRVSPLSTPSGGARSSPQGVRVHVQAMRSPTKGSVNWRQANSVNRREGDTLNAIARGSATSRSDSDARKTPISSTKTFSGLPSSDSANNVTAYFAGYSRRDSDFGRKRDYVEFMGRAMLRSQRLLRQHAKPFHRWPHMKPMSHTSPLIYPILRQLCHESDERMKSRLLSRFDMIFIGVERHVFVVSLRQLTKVLFDITDLLKHLNTKGARNLFWPMQERRKLLATEISALMTFWRRHLVLGDRLGASRGMGLARDAANAMHGVFKLLNRGPHESTVDLDHHSMTFARGLPVTKHAVHEDIRVCFKIYTYELRQVKSVLSRLQDRQIMLKNPACFVAMLHTLRITKTQDKAIDTVLNSTDSTALAMPNVFRAPGEMSRLLSELSQLRVSVGTDRKIYACFLIERMRRASMEEASHYAAAVWRQQELINSRVSQDIDQRIARLKAFGSQIYYDDVLSDPGLEIDDE